MKEKLKSVLKILIPAIIGILTTLGLYGCQGIQGVKMKCEGSYCIEKV